MNGPAFNHIENDIITRDSLGIESTVSSIAGDICPIVTTVTPRAFYWAFLTMLYDDYCNDNQFKERTYKDFYKYLRRNDYFFVVAVLLSGSEYSNLAGVTKAQQNINSGIQVFPFDETYFKANFGGMQYYNGGCRTLGFVADQYNGEVFSFAKIQPRGKRLADAFRDVIKGTTYYQQYRNSEESVPKYVLEEYGKVINLGLVGFDQCKQILGESLFGNQANKGLFDSARYLKYLYVEEGIKKLSLTESRHVLFDYFSPRGEKRDYPDDLRSIILQWEIETGRRYFVVGLEMIWKFMMDNLTSAMSLQEWIQKCVEKSSWTEDLETDMSVYLEGCDYSFDEREKVIDAARKGKANNIKTIENGLKLVLSVYKRFIDREDIESERAFLKYGNGCVSVYQMMKTVNEYKNRPTIEFLSQLMEKWLIKQHYYTALSKFQRGEDGFYYEFVAGKYSKCYDFSFDFQGNRMIQLQQVLTDLGIMEESYAF